MSLRTPVAVRRSVAVIAVAGLALGGLAATDLTAVAKPTPSTTKLNAGPQQLKQPGAPEGAKPAQQPVGLAKSGRQAFLVKLDAGSTMATYRSKIQTSSKTSARAAARSQLARVRSVQAATIAKLPSKSPVLFRTHSVLAGFGVSTDVRNVAALRALPNVTGIYPISAKQVSNSYAVPFQGAPAVWQGTGNLGQDSTIAVIDTGIDYTHADFGGPGTVAAYDKAHDAEAKAADPALFPNAKVIGGYDLAGDSYNADPASDTYQPVPHPDANPLDCNGHGSHVAGTAAGLGENADGRTYTGAYNAKTPFDTLKIGPGMAPKAKLYAFRVFGCDGSTDLVGAAIDRAADPNGDGDPSDHADVINMSLGSDFGLPDDGDSVLADAASDLGISVVVAAGNNGDLTDTAGSPGNAPKVIGVAATQDAANVLDALKVTIAGVAKSYGASRSAAYDWATKPDLAGTVVRSPADNRTGCAPYSAADAAVVKGHVVVVDWSKAGFAAGNECGSVARGTNLSTAGATGFIVAYSEEALDTAITGSDVIPAVITVRSGGAAIEAALDAGTPVVATGTAVNAIRQLLPVNNNKVSDFSSRGIHAAGNLKPDVAAVGETVFSAGSGTGSDGVVESGTSMATPMVAGLSALVRSAHPNWTPEQVKADIMNTAGQDVYVNGSAATDKGATYPPIRVGAGRIKADAAVANTVLAYNADDAGTVSVSFGPVQVTGPTTLTKRVKVQNTGLSTVTYRASYQAITEVPGVAYSVSPSTVTLSPRSSKTVTVTFAVADPTQLSKTVDPSVGRTAANGYPRETLAEASGRVLLAPSTASSTTTAAGSAKKAAAKASATSAPTLRVPVYAAPRPASEMTQAASLTLPPGAVQAGSLTLTGRDLDQGDADPADDIFSIAAGVELQATSGVAPKCTTGQTTYCYHDAEERGADLKYVGVTSDYPLTGDVAKSQAYLAISTHGAQSIPTRAEFDVYLDTNGDGTADLVTFNTRLTASDVFVSSTIDLKTGATVDTELINNRFGDVDTAAYDSDTLLMPISLAALGAYGVSPTQPRIGYGVAAYSASSGTLVDSVGVKATDDGVTLSKPLTADLFTPGVTVTQDGSGPLLPDVTGTEVTVTRNLASYQADRGLGLLMVHFHNLVGAKAQVVKLRSASTVALKVTPTTVRRGKTVKARVTVAGTAPVPTGTVTLVNAASGKTLATAALTKGRATVTYKPTKTGKLVLTAVYAGDDSHAGASSDPRTVRVTKAKHRS